VKDPKVLKQLIDLKTKNSNLRNQVGILDEIGDSETNLEKS